MCSNASEPFHSKLKPFQVSAQAHLFPGAGVLQPYGNRSRMCTNATEPYGSRSRMYSNANEPSHSETVSRERTFTVPQRVAKFLTTLLWKCCGDVLNVDGDCFVLTSTCW